MAQDGDNAPHIRIPLDLLECPMFTATDKIVYGYLKYRIGGNGHAWPGWRRIAKDCGASVSSVGRAIEKLTSAGLLRKKHSAQGSGLTNRYTLPTPDETRSILIALHPDSAIKMRVGALHPDSASAIKMTAQSEDRTMNQNTPPNPPLRKGGPRGARVTQKQLREEALQARAVKCNREMQEAEDRQAERAAARKAMP